MLSAGKSGQLAIDGIVVFGDEVIMACGVGGSTVAVIPPASVSEGGCTVEVWSGWQAKTISEKTNKDVATMQRRKLTPL